MFDRMARVITQAHCFKNWRVVRRAAGDCPIYCRDWRAEYTNNLTSRLNMMHSPEVVKNILSEMPQAKLRRPVCELCLF